MRLSFYKKYSLLLRAGAAVVLAVSLKLAAHALGWEILSLNPLFSGLVAANVFLMGFLLSGVLTDFKESERLPGEMASILETLMDEAQLMNERAEATLARSFSVHVLDLARTIHAWLYKQTESRVVMDRLTALNAFFVAFEPLTQANFIVRMKQEHQALRRILIRIDVIRETSFISSAYIIAEVSTVLLSIALVLTRMNPFYESFFMVGIIVFLLTFLIMLIRDLDDPFGYSDRSSAEDVSLKPLEDFIQRMSTDPLHDAADRSSRVASVIVEPSDAVSRSANVLRSSLPRTDAGSM